MPAQQLDLFAGAGNHSDQTGPRAVRYAVANSAAPSIRRRQTRRKAGFEPSVPLTKDPVLGGGSVISGMVEHGQCLSHGGPRVRIHLPPAESLSLAGLYLRGS